MEAVKMAKLTLSEAKKIINLSDRRYFDNLYKISLYNYSSNYSLVIANNEQMALDILTDYLEEKDENGHLYTYTELIKEESEEEIESRYVVAGNHCYYILSEHLQITQINE